MVNFTVVPKELGPEDLSHVMAPWTFTQPAS